MQVTMEDIMRACFGESTDTNCFDELEINFKKTINIKQYESEVSEASIKVRVPRGMSGAEKMVCLAIMQAQAEYEGYCMLAFKGQISNADLVERKKQLESGVTALVSKAEGILNKDMGYLFTGRLYR